jgi:hypothetical protein
MLERLRDSATNLESGCVALPHHFRSHSRLASRQWSLAPTKNSEEALVASRSAERHFFTVLKTVFSVKHLHKTCNLRSFL